MRQRLLAIGYAGTLLLLGGQSTYGYVADDRWSSTATNGSTGSMGTPITVTWSLAPENTIVPDDSGTTQNRLISFLDTNFGAGPGGNDYTQRPWYTYFEQSFARLSALSGVTYVHEPNDDGRAFNQWNAAGVLDVRGDVRIGGRSYDNFGTLASNYYPDYGEMLFNTDRGAYFKNSGGDYLRLRNTIMHEAMHGLGIKHVVSSDAAFLIEPTLGTGFDGPQLDDILALQRLYGDIYEKNGGNDFYHTATSLGLLPKESFLRLGTLGNNKVVSATETDFVSIDDNSDTDFFSFTIEERLDVQVALIPKGTTYQIAPQTDPQIAQTPYDTASLSNLSLALFDSNGSSLLASADNHGSGLPESIEHQLLPGTYYARIKGAHNDIQLYGLNLYGSVPLPGDLLWVGNLSASWANGVANFTSEGSATAFYDFDNVTFDDSSAVRNVYLPADLSAGEIRVTTSSNYTFTGPGGILAGNLIVDGPGTVNLNNFGNSYEGQTDVRSGTLRLLGSGTLAGEVHVASNATLELGSSYIIESTSRLSGSGTILGRFETPGAIAPGDLNVAGDTTGTLSFSSHLALFDTSRLDFEIGVTEQGIATWDAIDVAGAALLDGILEVSLFTAELPALNTTFELVHADAGIFGQFDNLLLPELSPNLSWNLIYSNFAVLLEVVDGNATNLPGDFNSDGVVDAADYVVWRKTSGSLGDYQDWLANFGASAGSGSGSIVNFSGNGAVPEPGAFALLAMGAIMALAVRRR